MKRVISLVIVAVLLFSMTACKSEKISTDETKDEPKIETKAENVEIIEEFEEDGELYYRKRGNIYEIVYRRLDVEIVSKEFLRSYEPVALDGTQGGMGDEGNRIYISEINVPNVYRDNTSISRVELTLYNCSGWFWDDIRVFPSGFKSFKKCESVMADLENEKMTSIGVFFYCPPKYSSIGLTDSSAKQNAIKAAIMDETIIKADITYIDNTTATEYLGFESYNGKHCNIMKIYRLEVK